MYKTNDPTFDQFSDDDYQSQGYIEAYNLISNLRAKTIKSLNDDELLEFRKTLAIAFDMTLK